MCLHAGRSALLRGGSPCSTDTHRARNRLRQLGLYGEYVIRVALVGIRPYRDSVRHTDERRDHLHVSVGAPHAALDDRSDVQLPADVGGQDVLPLERVRRAPRGHAELSGAGQRGGEIVREAVGEVGVCRVAADVHEWQHRDRLRGSWTGDDPARPLRHGALAACRDQRADYDDRHQGCGDQWPGSSRQ